MALLVAGCALLAARGSAAGAGAAAAGSGTAKDATGSAAHATGSAAAPAAGDPVVAQVLQMLRGGVGEPVILLWLEKSGKRPAAVDSADLVALHQAGASDALLKRLIELARGSAPAGAGTAPGGSAAARAPAPPAAAPGSPPASAPAQAASSPASASAPAAASAAPASTQAASSPAPASDSPAPSAATAAPAPAAAPGAAAPAAAAPAAAAPASAAPAAASPAPSAAAPAAAGVKVRLAVTYRPVTVGEELPPPEPWLMCVYVDGRFLASVRPSPVLLPLPARTFDRELAPGKHLLRITQERHLRYRAARGWVSPSRIDPSEFPFELPPGAAAQIAIHFGERGLRHPGPVAVRVEQDGKEIAKLEPAAADPEGWPALCEDVTAAMPAGAKPPAAARRELERCVHWAALWPGVAAVPTRDEVRAEIERQGRTP